MSEYDYGNRVVAVTGAGRGIGRAYALHLAARGARVVVNDLGGEMAGGGADSTPAQQVVDEIVAAGGTAAANRSDVSTPEGGEQVVAAALEAFGRIDAVVANAGIVRYAEFPEIDAANVQDHFDVHLLGTFNVIRAAWPHFVAQGYGRIVTTTSAGIFGLAPNLSYAVAKSGTLGLTRNAAVVGAAHGIKANAISPNAWTRMAGQPGTSSATGGTGQTDTSAIEAALDPALVAPMVGLLAHENCPVSGEVFAAGAHRFSRIFIGLTPGWVAEGDPTIEDLAAHLDQVLDEKDYTVPASLGEFTGAFLAHLRGS